MEEQILKILQQMQHQIGGIEGKIGGIEGKISGIEGKIDGIERRIGGLEQRIDGLDQRIGGLEQRMDSIESEMKCMHTELNDRIDRVEKKVTEVQVTIENELRPNIRIIAEGHITLNEKMQKIDFIAEDVEETKLRVELIETVVKRNGNTISRLNETVFR